MDNDSLTPSTNSTPQPATPSGVALFHPLDETNIFLDLKVLLTKPRYFFEFFVHTDRINQVVWAKVILIYLGLSALNSMVAPLTIPNWSANIDGLDPQLSMQIHRGLQQATSVASQVFSAILPFFTLIYTAIIAVSCLITLRLLGGDSERMSWSGIFCALIAAQWTTIFGFIPQIGGFVIALLPIVYSVAGLAQISKLSKLRSFFGAYILPAVLFAIVMSILASIVISLGVALFS